MPFFSFAGAPPEEEEVEGASRMLKVSGDTEGSYEGISYWREPLYLSALAQSFIQRSFPSKN